jgi:TetR/AcrR family transcriptional repressor of nem operon
MIARIPETKNRLIAAALELIWRSSYGSVSVDDICRAADVRKGSFYHFFPSKAELAVAAMDHADREMRATYDSVFSPGSPPLQRIADFADFVYRSQKESAEKYGHVCGCPCASLGAEMAAQEPAIRAKFEEQRRHKTRYYQNLIRDLVAEGLAPPDTDVKAKAGELFTYVMGRIMLARIENDLEPLERDLYNGILGALGVKAEARETA